MRSGPHRAVKWLLVARADAEKPVEGDLTPLRLAARFGNDEVVEALLDGRAQANTRGRFGYTALMVAAMYGHLEIVRLLLSHLTSYSPLSACVPRSWGSSEYQRRWRNGHRLGLSLPRSGRHAAATCGHVWLDRKPLRKRPFRHTSRCFQAFSALMIIANAVFLAFHSNAKMTNAYDVAFEGAVRAPEVHFLELFFATWRLISTLKAASSLRFVVEVVLLLLAANRDCPGLSFRRLSFAAQALSTTSSGLRRSAVGISSPRSSRSRPFSASSSAGTCRASRPDA